MTAPVQPTACEAQEAYYARTASLYDAMQVSDVDEHAIALGWMASMAQLYGFKSILDVGAGTGRALIYLKGKNDVQVLGVEPSEALRAIGHAKGISKTQLVAGDALKLDFDDDTFDLVCAFGVLHHIADHSRAVAEMARVAKRAVFISDANNMGQGPKRTRLIKQLLNAFRMWRLFDLVRTGFKGFHYSEGDGVFYSYSIFGDIPILSEKFPSIYFMSTRPSGPNLYRSAQTVAVLAARDQAGADR